MVQSLAFSTGKELAYSHEYLWMSWRRHVHSLLYENLYFMTCWGLVYLKYICSIYQVRLCTERFIFHNLGSAFLLYTHICCTYYVCQCWSDTLECQYCMCLYCTHMCSTYQQKLRLHLSLHETRNQRASRGCAADWQCNRVNDSHKSSLLRLRHTKLRCQQINSQFGSATHKVTLQAHLNPIRMFPM